MTPNLDLAEAALWLDLLAAWLEKEQKTQLDIDPRWTLIEIKPGKLKTIVEGLGKTAAIIRAAADTERATGAQADATILRNPSASVDVQPQPSCFALEEERGEGWKGSGAMKLIINEAQPSL